jgi:hypothetical protein
MAVRLALMLCAAVGVVLGSISTSVSARQQGQPADIDLPPMSWTCPMNGVALPDGTMHADVYEAEKGNCPICNMALVAVRLDTIWTCPVHAVVAEKHAGACPIDRRALVPMTVAVSWTCAGSPEIDRMAPGSCPDGSATVVKYTPRPHGNHNPQHGGQFFMAPDNWHHLEGALPRPRLVRIYVYDNYTKPLTRDRMRPVEGRVITNAAAAGVTSERSVPLVLSSDGRYLEAQVDGLTLPASLVAKVRLKADGPEHHFDFTFTGLSEEPPPPEAPTAPVQTPPTPAPPPTGIPARIDVPIPDTVDAIVAQIVERNRRIGELIDRGRLTDVWLPAFEAKELALAMGAHAAEMPTYKRTSLEPAIQRLLRAAWLLDGFGDLGNLAQVIAAYEEFRVAVSGIESFALVPR